MKNDMMHFTCYNPDSSAACPECTKALGKSYEINNYIKNIVNENKL